MPTTLFALAFLAVLTLLALYIAGVDLMIFGVAAGLMVLGGVWIWFGIALALAQAARLGWRRYRRQRPAVG